ncbi:hypothetical protein [Rubripirellula reticaptiva]|nr:hypothetical protein [Rubripirellula reticaptiva]
MGQSPASISSESMSPASTPYQSLRPVPREGTRIAPPAAQPQRDGWDLQWRRSPRIAAEQALIEQARQQQAARAQAAQAVQAQATLDQVRHAKAQAQAQAQASVAARSQAAAIPNPIRQVSGLQVSREMPSLRSVSDPAPAAAQSVSQTAWLTQPARVDDLMVPPQNLRVAQAPAVARPSTNDARRSAGSAADFFSDPFGDASLSAPAADPVAAPSAIPSPSAVRNVAAQTPQSIADDPIDDGFLFPPPSKEKEVVPPTAKPGQTNQLRDSFGFPTEPDAMPEPQPLEPQPSETQPRESGSSLGDMLRGDTPDAMKPDATKSGSDQELPPPRRDLGSPANGDFDNPFPSRRDAADRDRLNDPSQRSRDDEPGSYSGSEKNEMSQPTGITCSDFRDRIAFQTIDKISLDISPPYRPDEMEQSRYDKLKAEFDEKQSIRQWRNIDGTPLASGRLRELAYEKAIIETDFGTKEELQINRLSEADLAYISENWGLPKECLIDQVAYTPRNWTSSTMTWKASNLCHTPLYFEDVNLERYGHTRGPVLEPIVQTAHFFGSIAVLPYKMGVHAPNECTYSLGYYRPGNCAPWITPPVPLSLRGALYQTAAVTGAFWLVP